MTQRPSRYDRARLREGARGFTIGDPVTIPELKEAIYQLHSSICALQSMDDIGPEGNKKAMDDIATLNEKHERLKERLATILAEEKE